MKYKLRMFSMINCKQTSSFKILYLLNYYISGNNRRLLIVPRVRRSTFGARAFAIAGLTVWNSLPDSLRDPAVGPDQFRRDLKTHLFE